MNELNESKNIYRLPFDETLDLKIAPALFHYEVAWQEHAVDFHMPEGTPILASRSGLVFKVVDEFYDGGPDKKFLSLCNLIMIEHEHGEYSGYAHLKKNCNVSEGQYVEAGTVIALSGMSGYTTFPHLHFQIMIRDPSGGYGGWTTIPARFRIGDDILILRSPKE